MSRPAQFARPDNGQPALIERPSRLVAKLQGTLGNKWLKFAFRLGCTLLLFALLFKSTSLSWPLLLQKLSSLDDGGVLIGMLVGGIGVIISSYQWQSLLDAEHIYLDLRKLINLYLVGIAFNHFLPTGMGGDVVKAYYVGKGGNNPGSASAVVMSRITGFLGMLLVSVPALILWHAMFSRELIIVFLLSCLALCSALVGAYYCVTFLPRFLQGKWREKRLFVSINKIGNAVRKSAKRPRAMGSAIVFGMLFHVSAVLNYYSYAQILHMHVPLTFYLVAIPFVSLIAFLPISINGLGLRETAFVGIFSIMHVPSLTLLTLVALMDIQALIFGMIGGCIYLTMGERKSKHSRSHFEEVREASPLKISEEEQAISLPQH